MDSCLLYTSGHLPSRCQRQSSWPAQWPWKGSAVCGGGHARVGGGEQKGVGENAGIGFLNIPSSVSDFSLGKSTLFNMGDTRPSIKKFSSTSETSFFRGIAAAFRFGREMCIRDSSYSLN